ncbi:MULTISPECIES: hypothetical protein [unclassified Cobetia]|uniref:hypothetical protein n=1 Tax=unclassified Cobetia TaxID=2609414 RepID=UPI002097A705|nr:MULTISPECIES: hypothetical protein [unclassified Cobetia]MCO7231681.1 hypothetical protein [Cobetia sp. Dlab-2-AX]MCO7235003.1 hypothetical protein [Cobetia sp. Dlab-2-U]
MPFEPSDVEISPTGYMAFAYGEIFMKLLNESQMKEKYDLYVIDYKTFKAFNTKRLATLSYTNNIEFGQAACFSMEKY